jgi:hypothetical protein
VLVSIVHPEIFRRSLLLVTDHEITSDDKHIKHLSQQLCEAGKLGAKEIRKKKTDPVNSKTPREPHANAVIPTREESQWLLNIGMSAEEIRDLLKRGGLDIYDVGSLTSEVLEELGEIVGSKPRTSPVIENTSSLSTTEIRKHLRDAPTPKHRLPELLVDTVSSGNGTEDTARIKQTLPKIGPLIDIAEEYNAHRSKDVTKRLKDTT